MFDIIGDIHGHADELLALLNELGYEHFGGCYRHPRRQAIFLGDFIDRGPQISQVLGIVRPMVQNGAAQAVIGNHEFNALGYHTPDPLNGGASLRPHSEKNKLQHQATLEQLSHFELENALAWFRSLPFWLDLDGIRVVHACWDETLLPRISKNLPVTGTIDYPFLRRACDPDHSLFFAVEVVLKGREAALPADMTFLDKDGHARSAIRTKWYLPPADHSYRTYSLQSDPVDCDEPLDGGVIDAARPYPTDAKPVFIGHYWLRDATPAILAPNVACVDYSVAKGGQLCAYRWDGEQTLDNSKFVTVPAST